MMRTLLRLLLTFAPIVLAGGSLSAQQAGLPQPTPPLVSNAPDTSHWRVGMTSKREAPAPADKNSPAFAQWQDRQKIYSTITEILVSKAGDRRRTLTQYSSGKQDESYLSNGTLFVQRAGFVPGDIYITHQSGPENDFPELSWITLADYVDVEVANGRKYFVFRSQGGAPGGSEAWIDCVTKLPFKFSDASYERTYEFLNDASFSVEPSEIIAKRAAMQAGH